jgi:protein-L-isoaspartate(D-aspartate) O-methyltransferase
MAHDHWTLQRKRLAEDVSKTTKIRNRRIIDAIASVPREHFVTETLRSHAYEDRALPLTEEQTISQPSMVAIMLQELDCGPNDRVLEVGAGSGYAAALLGRIAGEVHAIELRPNLAHGARRVIERLGYDNVKIHVGDGSRGLAQFAPYDRILVSAGAAEIPEALVHDLAPGGRIAIPVGTDDFGQALMVGVKDADGTTHWKRTTPCIFVPLITDSEQASTAHSR